MTTSISMEAEISKRAQWVICGDLAFPESMDLLKILNLVFLGNQLPAKELVQVNYLIIDPQYLDTPLLYSEE